MRGRRLAGGGVVLLTALLTCLNVASGDPNSCGNGVLDDGEACDLGSAINGAHSGCTGDCKLAAGWTCTQLQGSAGSCTKVDKLGPLVAAYQKAAAACDPVGSGSGGSDQGSATGSGSGNGTGSGSSKGSAGETKEVGVKGIDFSTPDAPAFTLLGVTPTQVTQPQTAKQLAAAVGTVTGTDGKVRTGAAIELAPFKFTEPTLEDYLKRPYLYNIQISAATNQVATGSGAGSGSSGDVDGSIGVRSVLWTDADPIRNLSKDYWDALEADDAVADALDPFRGPPTDEGTAKDFSSTLCRAKKAIEIFDVTPAEAATWDQAELSVLKTKVQNLKNALAKDAQANDAVKKAQTDLKKKWNVSSFVVAAAIGETFTGGRWKNHTLRGGAVWFTASKGVSSWLQFLLTGRWHSEAAGATAGDTSLVGARAIAGTNTTAAYVEVGYNWLRSSVDSSLNDSWSQVATGVEIKVSDNTWLVLTFGGDIDRKGQTSDFFALSNLKWSVGGQTLKLGPELKQ